MCLFVFEVSFNVPPVNAVSMPTILKVTTLPCSRCFYLGAHWEIGVWAWWLNRHFVDLEPWYVVISNHFDFRVLKNLYRFLQIFDCKVEAPFPNSKLLCFHEFLAHNFCQKKRKFIFCRHFGSTALISCRRVISAWLAKRRWNKTGGWWFGKIAGKQKFFWRIEQLKQRIQSRFKYV